MVRWTSIALLALALTALAHGTAPRVAAHANLVRSLPAGNSVAAAPPSAVQLWFDDALEVGLNALAVQDSSGRVVTEGAPVLSDDRLSLTIALPPELPEDRYTVSYRTVSTSDGHNVRGFYIFSVGAARSVPAGASALAHLDWTMLPAPDTALLAWLSMAAALTLAGSVFLSSLLLRTTSQPDQGSNPTMARAVRWTIAGSALALLLLQVYALVRYASDVTGTPATELLTTSALVTTLASRFGSVWLVRVALTALLIMASWRWYGERAAAGTTGTIRRTLLTAAAAVVLLSFSAQSHAASVAASQATLWPMVMDWLHLLAAAVWFGGLFCLLLVWAIGRGAQRSGWLRQTAPAFGVRVLLATGVLAVTGLYQTGLQAPQPAPLHDTAYGWLLTIKGTLIAGALIAGVAARQALMADWPHGWRQFRLSGMALLRVEAVLSAVVLLAAAWLSNTPPPREAAATAARLTTPLGMRAANDLTTALAFRPRPAGGWEVEVALTDAAQRPLVNAARVTIGAGILGRDIGWSTVVAHPQGAGRYTTAVQWLASDGPWGMFVTVRRRGVAEDATALYGVRVAGTQLSSLNYSTSTSAIYVGDTRSTEFWGLVETAEHRSDESGAGNRCDVYITLTDPFGGYLEWADGVRVSAAPAIGLGGAVGNAGGYQTAEKLGPGRFVLRNVTMDVLGDWTVRTRVAGQGQETAAEGFFTFLATLDGVESLGGGFPPGHH